MKIHRLKFRTPVGTTHDQANTKLIEIDSIPGSGCMIHEYDVPNGAHCLEINWQTDEQKKEIDACLEKGYGPLDNTGFHAHECLLKKPP